MQKVPHSSQGTLMCFFCVCVGTVPLRYARQELKAMIPLLLGPTLSVGAEAAPDRPPGGSAAPQCLWRSGYMPCLTHNFANPSICDILDSQGQAIGLPSSDSTTTFLPGSVSPLAATPCGCSLTKQKQQKEGVHLKSQTNGDGRHGAWLQEFGLFSILVGVSDNPHRKQQINKKPPTAKPYGSQVLSLVPSRHQKSWDPQLRDPEGRSSLKDKLEHVRFSQAVSNLNIFISGIWSPVIVYLVLFVFFFFKDSF